jgi:adenine-specific DNA methylase
MSKLPNKLEPLAWRDRPALIEVAFPAQKVSIEAQCERKAGAGQTLTALGSYWKGRKPLVLVRACIIASLLPATDDPDFSGVLQLIQSAAIYRSTPDGLSPESPARC